MPAHKQIQILAASKSPGKHYKSWYQSLTNSGMGERERERERDRERERE
jgi:hypothetical protein